MPDKKLSAGKRKVQSRKQEKPYYCGPAVAQMILGGLGVTRTQNTLWDAIQDEADDQGLPTCEECEPVGCVDVNGSPPEALAAVLDSFGKAPIKLVSQTSAAATDHAIVWSVVNDVAAAAVVFGWAHWVVVYGYRVNRPPANAADTGYVLQGLHVRDPNTSKPATRYVTASDWRKNYLTGVECGRFTGRFVAVCDPDAPVPPRGPTVPSAKPKLSEGRLLSPARAAQVALEGIKEEELLNDVVWRNAMQQAKAGEPRLVHRLDRPQTFYFLVPFIKGGVVTAQALVDAGSGEFLEAQASEDRRQSLEMPATPDATARLLCGRRIDVPGWRRGAVLRYEGVTAAPTLVWKPCRESLSPYSPFTMASYGDRRFYVRADGQVFTALTQSGFGT